LISLLHESLPLIKPSPALSSNLLSATIHRLFPSSQRAYSLHQQGSAEETSRCPSLLQEPEEARCSIRHEARFNKTRRGNSSLDTNAGYALLLGLFSDVPSATKSRHTEMLSYKQHIIIIEIAREGLRLHQPSLLMLFLQDFFFMDLIGIDPSLRSRIPGTACASTASSVNPLSSSILTSLDPLLWNALHHMLATPLQIPLPRHGDRSRQLG
jgi:hypothetical protein